MTLSKQLLLSWIEQLKSGHFTAGAEALWVFTGWEEDEDGEENEIDVCQACCLGVLDYCFISKQQMEAAGFPLSYPEDFNLEKAVIQDLSPSTISKIQEKLENLGFRIANLTYIKESFTGNHQIQSALAELNDSAITCNLDDCRKYKQVIDVLEIMAEDPLFQ